MASGPITSWLIDRETMETVRDFIFLGSKIIADGDCSHEIKRGLLLGRKVMTNLDSILKSILKSRDITLPTKVRLVNLQGIFPIQGSNPHLLRLPHWQMGSLSLCHLGSPKQTCLRSHQNLNLDSWIQSPEGKILSELWTLIIHIHQAEQDVQIKPSKRCQRMSVFCGMAWKFGSINTGAQTAHKPENSKRKPSLISEWKPRCTKTLWWDLRNLCVMFLFPKLDTML